MLGGFSSAFFLYGIAFVYGIAHTTRLDRVGSALAGEAAAHPTLSLVALGLLLVGFAFKVSAVPFHMWTPDAYEGAPTIVSGFMSTGVKAAAFAAFAAGDGVGASNRCARPGSPSSGAWPRRR